MKRLDHEDFFAQLRQAFEETRESGSISLTMKRVTPAELKVSEEQLAGKAPTAQVRAHDAKAADGPACLVRVLKTGGVRAGSKVGTRKRNRKIKAKFSTLVTGTSQELFHDRMYNLSKASMTSLKKRQRKRGQQAGKK